MTELHNAIGERVVVRSWDGKTIIGSGVIQDVVSLKGVTFACVHVDGQPGRYLRQLNELSLKWWQP